MSQEDFDNLIRNGKEVEFSSYPIMKTGGQSCGIIHRGVTLKAPSFNFEVSINYHRSQLKNKEAAVLIFELFIWGLP